MQPGIFCADRKNALPANSNSDFQQPMTRRNLILIHRGPEYEQDFTEISEKVFAIDPDITIYSLATGSTDQLPEAAWQRPTLTVALNSKISLEVRRGPVLKCHQIDKLAQQKIFRDAGIPTPPMLPFKIGMKLDPILFGEFVVIKPMSLGLSSRGKGIQLFRRKRLEQIAPWDFPEGHLIHRDKQGYLVQKFIDTGNRTAWHRVSTFFSTPIYSAYSISNQPIVNLDTPDDVIERTDITNVIETDRIQLFSTEQDVLNLAIKVHCALASIPLLGIDILRDQKSGDLFVLECNPGGNTWHFSSQNGREWRLLIGKFGEVSAKTADRNARKMLINQFGAFDLAAQILVEKTRQLAS